MTIDPTTHTSSHRLDDRTVDRPTPRDPEYDGSPDPAQEEHDRWQDRARIVLTPVPGPSVLGLFAFGVSTFMVASVLAGWWGNDVTSSVVLAPFAFFFGGLAQLLAGMWSYRARDVVATAMHGAWGAFWLGWGWMVLLVTLGVLPPAVLSSRAFGFWFIGLCIVTLFGAIGASFANWSLTATLGLLTAGSGLLAAGLVGGLHFLVTAGGWVLVASALAAFYTGGALLLAEAAGRVVLPTGARESGADVPGTRLSRPIEYRHGMPGSKVGQ